MEAKIARDLYLISLIFAHKTGRLAKRFSFKKFRSRQVQNPFWDILGETSVGRKIGHGEIALGFIVFLVTSSILLSGFIFLRFQSLSIPEFSIGNVVLYFLNYFFVPLAASLWSVYFLLTMLLTILKSNRHMRSHILLLAIWVLGFIILLLTVTGFLAQYLSLPIPAVLIFLIYLDQHWSSARSLQKVLISAIMCIFVIFAPFSTAFIGYNQVLYEATKINDETQQALFVSKFVYNITTNWPTLKGMLRANDDFLKFLLNGDGACGETAMATSNFLRKLGFNAYKAGFPGEDHSFTEVQIDGKWEVLDQSPRK
jgi:hypothetical protein